MNYLGLLLVFAQGVTDGSILIGMEGAARSFSTDEENLGMHLVIRHRNALGGIHGRKIDVAAYPRGRENAVEQALANVKRLNENAVTIWKWRCGGQPPLTVMSPRRANSSPSPTSAPLLSPSSESSLRCP